MLEAPGAPVSPRAAGKGVVPCRPAPGRNKGRPVEELTTRPALISPFTKLTKLFDAAELPAVLGTTVQLEPFEMSLTMTASLRPPDGSRGLVMYLSEDRKSTRLNSSH